MRHGFTLIELLVVITIIVVLLSLLTPALDQAIYQAELAVCAASNRGAATGVTNYAMNHRRHYPHRQLSGTGLTHSVISDLRPDAINKADDRLILEGYVPMDLLLCPLNGDIDLDPSATRDSGLVFAAKNVWYDTEFTGQNRASKYGRRFSYGDYKFSVLFAGQYFRVVSISHTRNSHPDKDGVMRNIKEQNSNDYQTGLLPADAYTLTYWTADGTLPGPIDMQFAYQDNSVVRLNDVSIGPDLRIDERMIDLPEYMNGAFYPDYQTYLPIEHR